MNQITGVTFYTGSSVCQWIRLPENRTFTKTATWAVTTVTWHNGYRCERRVTTTRRPTQERAYNMIREAVIAAKQESKQAKKLNPK